jgi:hypothetical protein
MNNKAKLKTIKEKEFTRRLVTEETEVSLPSS